MWNKNIILDRQTDRQTWIDVYKGIAILLVVLGHLEIDGGLYRFIFSFHMYAFFFIAGVTFKIDGKRTFKEYIINNIKRLYIPYLFFAFMWDITSMVISMYLKQNIDLSVWGFAKNIFAVIIGGGVFHSTASIGPAWFLYSLLVVRTVYYIMAKSSDNNPFVLGIVSAIFYAFGYICNGKSYLPFKLFSSMTAFVFFFAGNLAKERLVKLNLKRKNIEEIMLFVVTFLLVYKLSKYANCNLILVSNVLPSNWNLVLLCGLSGCVLLYVLSLILSKIPVVNTILIFFGMNSLIVMGVHSEIHMLLSLILEKFLQVPGEMTVVPIFGITMFLCVPLSKGLNQFFPELVGKRKINKAKRIG